jgi:hypothetical protein
MRFSFVKVVRANDLSVIISFLGVVVLLFWMLRLVGPNGFNSLKVRLTRCAVLCKYMWGVVGQSLIYMFVICYYYFPIWGKVYLSVFLLLLF